MIAPRKILTIIILASVSLIVATSCTGRVRERIENRREDNTAQTSDGQEKPTLGEVPRDASAAFAYESTPINASITPFEAQGVADRAILDDSYTLYSLKYESMGETVPALLAIPKEGNGPFPVVLMLHGHRSSKAYMIRRYSTELARRGIASVAIDLPLQGERKVEGREYFSGDPETTAQTLKRSVIDARRAIDWIETRDDLDSGRLALIGYSLGSWISTMTAAADQRPQAVALNVVGEGAPEALQGDWETFSEEHPVLSRLAERRGIDIASGGMQGLSMEEWIASISPRAILMLNGRDDRIVNPEGSRKLFEAAKDPKEILWYDSGHILPEEATTDCIEWVAEKLMPE